MHTDQINELATALAKAQGAIEGAAKAKQNPHFRSKYADLGAVWDACRGPLSTNGLSVLQQPRTIDGRVHLVTRVMHESGQWIEDDGIPLLAPKQDMQGFGSALTYARRYGLMAAVGIAPEDDDGNAASAGKPENVAGGKKSEKNGTTSQQLAEDTQERIANGVATLRDELNQCMTQADIDAWGVRNADKLAFIAKHVPKEDDALTEHRQALEDQINNPVQEAAE